MRQAEWELSRGEFKGKRTGNGSCQANGMNSAVTWEQPGLPELQGEGSLKRKS